MAQPTPPPIDPKLQAQLERIATWTDLDFDIIHNDAAPNDSFDVVISFGGIDPAGMEVEEEVTIGMTCEANVEDFGIGTYEFWGAKGNDVQMGWEIEVLEFDHPIPEALKPVFEKIMAQVETTILESDLPDGHDEPDWPEPPDPYDW